MLISYSNGMFIFQPETPTTQSEQDSSMQAVQLEALASGHLTIDLASQPTTVAKAQEVWLLRSPESDSFAQSIEQGSHGVESCLMMVDQSSSCFLDSSSQPISGWLQLLAQKLQALRDQQATRHDQQGALSMRRSQAVRLPLLWQSQGRCTEAEPVRRMDHVHKLWPPFEVHDKERGPWPHSPDGSRSFHHSPCPRDTPEDDKCGRDECRHGERQNDGNQGNHAPDGIQDILVPESDLGGVREEAGRADGVTQIPKAEGKTAESKPSEAAPPKTKGVPSPGTPATTVPGSPSQLPSSAKTPDSPLKESILKMKTRVKKSPSPARTKEESRSQSPTRGYQPGQPSEWAAVEAPVIDVTSEDELMETKETAKEDP